MMTLYTLTCPKCAHCAPTEECPECGYEGDALEFLPAAPCDALAVYRRALEGVMWATREIDRLPPRGHAQFIASAEIYLTVLSQLCAELEAGVDLLAPEDRAAVKAALRECKACWYRTESGVIAQLADLRPAA